MFKTIKAQRTASLRFDKKPGNLAGYRDNLYGRKGEVDTASREEVVEWLAKAHLRREPVRLDSLKANNPPVYKIITCEGNTILPLFTGIISAREEAARYLYAKDRGDEARTLRAYNNYAKSRKNDPLILRKIESPPSIEEMVNMDNKDLIEVRDRYARPARALSKWDTKPVSKKTVENAEKALDAYRSACIVLASNNKGLMFMALRRRVPLDSNSIESAEAYDAAEKSLLRAATGFDAKIGVRFSTYAVSSIKRELARRFRRKMEGPRTLSLEYRSRQEEREEMGGTLTVETIEDKKFLELNGDFHAALRKLEPRELEIISRRFGLYKNNVPQTLEDIGVEVKISKERVRQIQNFALEKLRLILSKDE